MNQRKLLALSGTGLIIAALSLVEAAPKGKPYKLAKKGSSFKVFVYKRGFASAFAHDHIIGVRDFEGAVEYDPAAPEKSRVSITVDAASLQVLDSELDADDRAEVKSNMDSDEVLDVKKYPKIRFRSTRVKVLRKTALSGKRKGWDMRLKLTGALELHGKKKSVDVLVEVIDEGSRLVTSGEFKVKQTDFGMEPFSAVWGAVGVQDVVKLRFRLVSQRP